MVCQEILLENLLIMDAIKGYFDVLEGLKGRRKKSRGESLHTNFSSIHLALSINIIDHSLIIFCISAHNYDSSSSVKRILERYILEEASSGATGD